jgi:hypothetical protein
MSSRAKHTCELIAAEADELLEAYGNDAYWKARNIARAARKHGDYRIDRFYSAVAREIAKCSDFKIGLNTIPSYPKPQDPSAGIVRKRPHEATLH